MRRTLLAWIAVLAANAGPGPYAAAGRIVISPGVYVLRRSALAGPGALPATARALGMAEFHEFHVPPLDTVPPVVIPELRAEHLTVGRVEIAARVVDSVAPDSLVVEVERAARVEVEWVRLELR